ncbi:cadherin domain-containing protein [Nocardioides sp. LHD-245]|uniref:cadherin domain-containing protein n=1 Tax=Nocardioides sp. LHD-245 TaxID=3051387 RepID=UPI0027DF7E30|nr:cadherin domain-containing protein [Nocardioides sp. LHD-245]
MTNSSWWGSRGLGRVAALAAALLVVGALQVVHGVTASAAGPGCTIVGTPGPNTLVGNAERNVICGRGGDDRLIGRRGKDELRGAGGDDRLLGRRGRDVLRGGQGDDVLSGGRGNDRLDGRDGGRFRDILNCGPGKRDRAFVDPGDVVRSSCEIVVQNHRPTDVTLSPSSVIETAPVGTEVGSLSAADPDPRDDHVFRLVPGRGAADNAAFRISGDHLETAAVLDFEEDPELSIRVRATDRSGTSVKRVLKVTVTNASEGTAAPAIAGLEIGTLGYVENDPATVITASGTVTDPDSANFATGTLTVDYASGGQAEDRLAINNQGTGAGQIGVAGVSVTFGGSPIGTFTGGTGAVPLIITLNADATRTATATLLRNITYRNASDAPSTTARAVRFVLTDGDGGTSNPATRGIAVAAVDDAPLALDDSVTVAQDAAAVPVAVLTNDTDLDGGPRTIASASDPTHGTVALIGGSAGAHAGLTYRPDTGYCNTSVGGPDAFTYTLNGGSIATVFATVTCPPVPTNDPPTDITLGNNSVAENRPVNTVVGGLSATDPDVGNTHTFMLVAGAGSADNASFDIAGAGLRTSAVFDFEAKASYAVRVRVTDQGGLTFEKQFTVTVTNAAENAAPTNLSLSDLSVAENEPVNTAVGSLSATDPDVGDTHTFTLVAGTGSADNASFTISGTGLRTSAVFDFEAKASYAVRVRVTDQGGLTFEKSFTVTVTNAAENAAPTNLSLSDLSVAENRPVNTVVGGLSATDPDVGDTHTFTLVAGAGSADNASFDIAGAGLRTSAVFDFEAKASYAVRVRVTDQGGLTFEKQFTVTVTNAAENAAPTNLSLSDLSVAENEPVNTAVGSLSATDPDVGDTHTFTLVAGTGSADNASFTISGTGLRTSAVFDFEAKASYAVRVRVTDQGGLTFEKSFTVTVTNVNEAPVADNDSFGDALGNTRFVVGTTSTGPLLGPIPGSVLDGDTDVDTPAANLTAGPASITSTQCASTCAGNVTMQPDGQFIYDPKPGFTGSDTFTYTLSDNSVVAPANQTATGTVTIKVVGPVVWYVDGDASAAGDGRSHSPSKTLSALSTGGSLDALDKTFDVILVYGAAAPYAGGLVLEDGQRLIGEPHSLDVDPSGDIGLINDVVPAGGSNPVIVNASGDGLNLALGNEIQGIDLGNASGAALFGNDVSSAMMNTVTPGVIDNATVGGRAVDISLGTLSMAFTSVSSTGGPHGMRFDHTQGSFVAGGGSLSNATGTDVLITGDRSFDDLAFTYGGAISDDSGPLIRISDQTGGVKRFTGPITDLPATPGNGGGILLQDNFLGSNTFRFEGGLNLSTGTSSAIVGRNGGTLAITDPGGVGVGVDNTLASSTGTALDIDGITIHGDDLTFRSISANGAPSGIALTNTGTAGGLIVTGTGAPDSGGTIANTTGPGVALTGTDHVSLNNLRIQGANRSGVQGADVTNFSFTNGAIVNAGDARADDNDSSIAFNTTSGGHNNNIDGLVTITGSTLTGAFGGGVDIFNYDGTISSATITGNTISSSFVPEDSKRSGIALNLFGSSTTVASLTKATIANNTVTGFPSGDGISIQGASTASSTAPPGTYGVPGSATDVVSITGNQVIGDTTNKINGFGISASVTGRGQGNFSITDNGTVGSPLRNMKSSAIAIGLAGDATAYFTVTGNQINANNGFSTAAIALGTDKNIQADLSTLATPTARATITGNTIANTSGPGIRILHRDSNGTLNLRLENNANTGVQGLLLSGIRVENGSSGDAAYNPTLCASIASNSATSAPVSGGDKNGGINVYKESDAAATYKFGLVGLTPSPATAAQTETFLAGQNPASETGVGFFAGKKVVVRTGDQFTSCTLPAGM